MEITGRILLESSQHFVEWDGEGFSAIFFGLRDGAKMVPIPFHQVDDVIHLLMKGQELLKVLESRDES